MTETRTPQRVCLVTSGNLSSNPRWLKKPLLCSVPEMGIEGQLGLNGEG